MMEKALSRSIRLMCLGGVAFGMHAAYAQETQPVAMQRVEVTGSRIASPNAESPSPLQVLTSQDIAASGVNNLQDLLLQNPTLGTPTYSRTNTAFLTTCATSARRVPWCWSTAAASCPAFRAAPRST
jgi:outer membrane receptor for ferrienterochelin and colicin